LIEPQQAGAVRRQRLLAAVVHDQTVGIEGVDAGDFNVEYLGLRPSRSIASISARKSFAVGPAAEAAIDAASLACLPPWQANLLGEAHQAAPEDHQRTVGFDRRRHAQAEAGMR